jgi:hypothetical protein
MLANSRIHSLDVIDIARPCPADWNEMRGDEGVRFCRHCSLHVYNLSAMTRQQAETLVGSATSEGRRLCVRFYRRADGTVTTTDCEGWWRLTRRRMNRWTSAAVALLLAAVGTSRWSHASATPKHETDIPVVKPNVPVALQGDVMIMGKVRVPASQPAIMGGIAPALPPTTQPTTQPAQQ